MLQNFGLLWKFLLILLICRTIHGRPRPDEKSGSKSVASKEILENPELVGGSLDLLVSDMYKRIIRERLENLLEGVSAESLKIQQRIGAELIESSDPLNRKEDIKTHEEKEQLVEVSLPISITEIPQEIFTSLPGTIMGIMKLILCIPKCLPFSTTFRYLQKVESLLT